MQEYWCCVRARTQPLVSFWNPCDKYQYNIHHLIICLILSYSASPPPVIVMTKNTDAKPASSTLHQNGLALVNDPRYANQPAFVVVGSDATIKSSSTRREMDERSTLLALGLRRLIGTDASFRNATQQRQQMQKYVVNVISPVNTVEFAEAMLAASKAGVVLGALPGGLAVSEIFHVQEHSSPSVLIMNYRSLDKVLQVLQMGGFGSVTKFIVWGDQNDLDSFQDKLNQLPNWISYDEVLETERQNIAKEGSIVPNIDEWGSSNPDEIFGLFLTSGSTGMPKLVRLPHCRVLVEGYDAPAQGDISNESVLVSFPFSYSLSPLLAFGMIHSGMKAIIMDQHTHEGYITVLQRFRCEHVRWMPNMFMAMIALDECTIKEIRQHLKSIFYAGARMPLPAKIEAMRLFGPHVLNQGYGSTEVGLVAMLSCIDHQKAWDDIRAGLDASSSIHIKHLNSTGPSAKTTKVLIVDRNGAPVPTAQVGRIFVQVPYLVGYLNNEKAEKKLRQKSTTGEEWLDTSDHGFIDEDGYLHVSGRAVDAMYISENRIVYSADIEDVLQASDLVKVVAVLPMKDHNGAFDEVVAFVVAEETPHDVAHVEYLLREHCKASNLEEWKHPKHFRFLPKLPSVRNYKVDKIALRKSFSNST